VIIGNDASGEVVAIGKDVRDVKVGDRVLVDPTDRVDGKFFGETLDGGLSEFIRVPSHMLIGLDPAISFADAAALPVAYGTAHRMMVSRGKVKAGERVLILGASGGVGTCCVQLAKQAGCTVIVCASTDDKLAQLKAQGADVLINYATTDWVAECQKLFGKARTRRGGHESGGVDVVVNFTGGDTWTKALKVMKRDGRMLTCGATAGYDPKEDIRYIWTFELNIIGSNGWTREDIRALLDLVKAGKIKPVLHPTRYRLEQGAEALRQLEDRLAVGKVIVEP
jgi:NADPH:quinone reductase-like Zn-dependent oxidoreductase